MRQFGSLSLYCKMRIIPAVPLTCKIFVRLKHLMCENTLQITVKNYKNIQGGLVMIYVIKIILGWPQHLITFP